MRSIDRTTKTLVSEDGRRHIIDYAILVEDCGGGESYGLSVASRTGGGRVHIRGITPSADKITRLHELFVRHGVTPSSARDVAENWLTDCDL